MGAPRPSSSVPKKRRRRRRRRTSHRWPRSRTRLRRQSGSAAASGAARDRMAEPGSKVADLVQRLGRDDVRALTDELGALWRGDSRVSDRAAAPLGGPFPELGLVTREKLEEAELRIAQPRHR